MTARALAEAALAAAFGWTPTDVAEEAEAIGEDVDGWAAAEWVDFMASHAGDVDPEDAAAYDQAIKAIEAGATA